MDKLTVTPMQQGNRFVTLDAPDGKNRVWISKHDIKGQVKILFSFSLRGLMCMVDALDAKPYLNVIKAYNIDSEISGLQIQLTEVHQGNLARLMDDLCEIMDQYVFSKDPKS